MFAEKAEDSAAEEHTTDTVMKHLAKQIMPRALEFCTVSCHVIIQPNCKYINTNLFWSKYSSNIVSDALAASCAENCASLSLPILIGAGNTHTSRDNTVGLQDVDHFTILLGKNTQYHG